MDILRIGITGGIASGKTTVTEIWQELYPVVVIDADVINHQLLQQPDVVHSIVQKLGFQVLMPNTNNINKVKLRELIYNDSAAKLKLESILHPKIRSRIIKSTKDAQNSYVNTSTPYILVVIPLLIENICFDLVDRVVVIHTTKHDQIQRVQLRDHISTSMAERIIKHQLPTEILLQHAHYNIDTFNVNTTKLIDRIHIINKSIVNI